LVDSCQLRQRTFTLGRRPKKETAPKEKTVKKVVTKQHLVLLSKTTYNLLTEFSANGKSWARRLSNLTGRNEKLAVRGQIFENLRANSRAICRKLSDTWTDPTILQSVYGKTDSLRGGY